MSELGKGRLADFHALAPKQNLPSTLEAYKEALFSSDRIKEDGARGGNGGEKKNPTERQ